MQIKWNEVTWYSKLAAVIFFLGVLPVLMFYIGFKYKEATTDYVIVLAKTTSVLKQTITSTTSISKWIGLSYVSLPSAIKKTGGGLQVDNGLPNNNLSIQDMFTDDGEEIWLMRISDKNGQDEFTVLDSLQPLTASSGLVLLWDNQCKYKNGVSGTLPIIAWVEEKFVGKGTWIDASKAWRMNITNNKFEKIMTASVTCWGGGQEGY